MNAGSVLLQEPRGGPQNLAEHDSKYPAFVLLPATHFRRGVRCNFVEAAGNCDVEMIARRVGVLQLRRPGASLDLAAVAQIDILRRRSHTDPSSFSFLLSRVPQEAFFHERLTQGLFTSFRHHMLLDGLVPMPFPQHAASSG